MIRSSSDLRPKGLAHRVGKYPPFLDLLQILQNRVVNFDRSSHDVLMIINDASKDYLARGGKTLKREFKVGPFREGMARQSALAALPRPHKEDDGKKFEGELKTIGTQSIDIFHSPLSRFTPPP